VKREQHKVISLFSGAMGLDLGLEQVGLKTSVCVEIDRACCETIRRNRPTIPVIESDISTLTTEQILSTADLTPADVFAIVGGPPCQSFSTGGLRQSLQDKRGSLFAEFLRVVDEVRPLYFVFENVAQIITAAVKHRPIAERPGQRWHLSSYTANGGLVDEEQSGSALNVVLDAFDGLGYSLNFGILNAANFGAPQRRMRFVLIGSRVQRHVPLPRSTHAQFPADGEMPWRTLRDALQELHEANPLHSNYSPEFQRYFSMIPPGGNWRALPPNLQREALGEKAFVAGGGKTGFFRRLAWDEPAPTIVGKPNRKSSAICHPEHDRPLTVRESARVQGFPDDWEFSGAMHDQYLQIGNAVPIALGQAIGRTLNEAYATFLDLHSPPDELSYLHDWRQMRAKMLDEAHQTLRAAARNKRSRKAVDSVTPLVQRSLFD
jgi:DNA (cytosine-5)-methyltransferase 1